MIGCTLIIRGTPALIGNFCYCERRNRCTKFLLFRLMNNTVLTLFFINRLIFKIGGLSENKLFIILNEGKTVYIMPSLALR